MEIPSMTLKDLLKRFTPAFIWRAAQRIRRRYELSAFNIYIVTHTYAGFELKVSIENVLGRAWYDKDYPALKEIELLKNGKLKPGAIVYDVGAHQGVIAMVLARIVTESGLVLAIEADPHSAAVAQRNRGLNDLKQLRVLHAAGGAASGEVEFAFTSGRVRTDGSTDAATIVKLVKMDDLTAEHGVPDVLFIDVEGYEEEVLKGSRRILATRPDCYVEVHVGLGLEQAGGSVAKLMDYFPKEHYTVLIALPHAGEFVPFDKDSSILKKHFLLVALSTMG
jgi:FkbM family methyltransferase